MRFTFPLLLILIFGLNYLQAQNPTIPKKENRVDANGLRQGEWAVWFDKDFKPTDKLEFVQFYRLISYKDDKPIGEVRDFYSSGQLQWEGKLLADKPSDQYEGEAIWYRKDGSIKSRNFYDEGALVSFIEYDSDGEIARQGKDKPYFIDLSKADARFAREDCLGALQLYEKCYPKFAEMLGNQKAWEAKSIGNMAVCFGKLGKTDKAEEFRMRSQVLTEKLSNEAGNTFATINGYYHGNQAKKAVEMTKLMIDYYEKSLINDNDLEGLASLYWMLGTCQTGLANFAEASQSMRKAKSFQAESKLGKNNRDYLKYSYELATMLSDLKEYEQAAKVLAEILEIVNEHFGGKNFLKYNTYANALASTCNELGKHQQALEIQTGVLARADSTSEIYPVYCNNMALIHEKLNNYAENEHYLLKALEQENTLSTGHYKSVLWSNLAMFYARTFRWENAKDFCR